MNRPTDETPLNPDDILTQCALRFDGYKYIEATGFEPKKALERYFEMGNWDLTTEEKLAVFFSLQRALYKWGLERSAQDDPHRIAFRELFFELAETAVPPAYARADFLEQWNRLYADRIGECLACVRRVHEGGPA